MKPQGILVIKNLNGCLRDNSNSAPPYVLSYPIQEIWENYHGVGGDIGWPDIGSPTPCLIDGLASVDSIISCWEYWETAKTKYPDDKVNLLAIGDVEKCNNFRFIFLGYDCGDINEYDNFSAILDDLIIRKFPEFALFNYLLNKNLLFSSLTDAKAFLAKRQELLRQGYPLETDDNEFYPIPIYSITSINKGR